MNSGGHWGAHPRAAARRSYAEMPSASSSELALHEETLVTPTDGNPKTYMPDQTMFPHFADYLDIIEACHGRRQDLDRKLRFELLQEWRQVFAARLHAATGKWKRTGYPEWDVFTFPRFRAITGEKAAVAYASLDVPPSFIVCPEDEYTGTFRIIGGTLPNLRPTGLDVYVWPDDLAWTMAFTHEDGLFGPYFSRREWVEGR